jgi:hypothetical protein
MYAELRKNPGDYSGASIEALPIGARDVIAMWRAAGTPDQSPDRSTEALVANALGLHTTMQGALQNAKESVEATVKDFNNQAAQLRIAYKNAPADQKMAILKQWAELRQQEANDGVTPTKGRLGGKNTRPQPNVGGIQVPRRDVGAARQAMAGQGLGQQPVTGSAANPFQ